MITTEDFIANLENEFEDLEKGKLLAESKFKDFFEWNSINALIIIAMVSTEYDVTLNAEDMRQCNTVQEMVDVINERTEE